MLPDNQTPLLTAPSSITIPDLDEGEQSLLPDALAMVFNFCGRRFESEAVTASYTIIAPNTGLPVTGGLHLTQTPVTAITALIYNTGDSPTKDQYVLHTTSGLLWLFDSPRNSTSIEITYTGGYSTLPPDVTRAVIIIVRAMDSVTDPNRRKATLGGYLTYEDEIPQRVLPYAAKTLLAPYKRRSVL